MTVGPFHNLKNYYLNRYYENVTTIWEQNEEGILALSGLTDILIFKKSSQI